MTRPFATISMIFLIALIFLPQNSKAADRPSTIKLNTEPQVWNFTAGPEFPGAKGTLSKISDQEFKGMEISYDFTQGGAYVGTTAKSPISGLFSHLEAEVYASTDCTINYRLFNPKPKGRVFQGKKIPLKGGEWQTVSFSMNGPWQTAWGGNKGDRVAPKVRLGLLINAGKEKAGIIRIKNLHGVIPENSTFGFDYPEVDFELSGWHVHGTWNNAWPISSFEGMIERIDGDDGEFSLSFPQMGRDATQRIALHGDKKIPFSFSFPPKLEPNPRNSYQLRLNVSTQSGESTRVAVIRGKAANSTDLGSPRTSLEIDSLPFGTCTHLAVGRKGAFRIWNNHDRILEEISNCGYKWIRDGLRTEKTKTGYVVDPYDIGWLKKAKSLNIHVIGLIHMNAKESMDDLKARVTAVVEQTKGLVAAYELGNEPNNFGNWRKIYGGPWNGKEKDNSTSPWVKEHLKATNMMAETVHEILPDATIIGTGAVSPTNFRYLDLGLSPLVTGIVDHPYSCSLPPERVPFGTAMAKRDGVKLGDDQNSFKGLIKSYYRKFEETGIPRDIWATEFGWTTFWFNGKNHNGLQAGYSERAQAVYLVRRFMQSLALPIKASTQYDFVDDYGSKADHGEANFGLLRSDFSRKPSFYAIQRMNAILGDCAYDKSVSITVENDGLHRGQVRSELVKDWDEVSIAASNEVHAYGYTNPNRPDARYLAVWSALPLDSEFNNRVTTINIEGWDDFNQPPVAVDLMSGVSFDVPLKATDAGITLENLSLGDAPLIITLYR